MILPVPYLELPFSSPAFPGVNKTYRPSVDTTLQFGNTQLPFFFESVIDSGADHCLFPSAYTSFLGINLEDAPSHQMSGVGSLGRAYFHKVRVIVKIKETLLHFDCYAGFSSLLVSFGLLGRHGFFELFKEVTFDEKTKVVRLNMEMENKISSYEAKPK